MEEAWELWSVTGNEHYQIPFRPLVGGIRFADYNDLESVKAQFSEHTCAVILETVQGEGGIYPGHGGILKRGEGALRGA